MGSSVGSAFSENVNAGLALLTLTGQAAAASIQNGVVGFDETIAGKASRAASYEMVNQLIKESVF